MTIEIDKLPPDLRGERINVVYLDMEIGIPEQVTRNHDGSYTVFLNARYSYERWADSIRHALNHIRNNDHDKENVQTIERNAHA